MWPFIRGDIAARLRKNDDIMFVLQAQLGLGLVVLMFLTIISFLAGRLLNLWEQAQWLLLLEVVLGIWFGLAYSQITRWRRQWADENFHPDRAADDFAPLGESLRELANWGSKRKKDKALEVKSVEVPKAQTEPKATSRESGAVPVPAAA